MKDIDLNKLSRKELINIIAVKDKIIIDKDKIIFNKDNIIQDKEREISNKENIIQDKEREISNKDNIIQDKEREISNKDNIIQDKEREISNKENIIRDNEKLIDDQIEIINNQENIILAKEKEVKEMQEELENKLSEIRDLQLSLSNLLAEINKKDFRLARQLSDRFAPSTEKKEYIVNEVEKIFNEQIVPIEKEKKKVGRKKGKQNHDNIDLKKVEVIDEYLDVDNSTCSCNHDLIDTNEEVINKFEFIPAKFILKKVHIKHKKCSFCNKKYSAEDKLDIFGKSSLTPSLASNIATYKYQYGLPLYRIEQIFNSEGVNISRQSLATYMIKLAEELEPIYNKLKERLLNNNARLIHADETTLRVIDTKERINSYMFLYTTSYYDYPIALYEYQIDRGASHIKDFFNNYDGYIICDAYSGYNVINENKRAYCYFHAREKFARIVKTLPEDKRASSIANKLITMLEEAFRFEKKYLKDKLTPSKIKDRRKEEVKPIIDKYFDTLKKLKKESSYPLSSAIDYSLKNEKGLRLFLSNPYIPMTNNAAERAIKSFVIDRKNFLFSYSSTGAKASGIIMTIVQSAKLNLLQPNKYIEYVLNNINKTKISEIDKLLPFSSNLPNKLYHEALIEE